MQASRLTLNTGMSLAQSIRWEGRVDYCCTTYVPENGDAALTGFEAEVIATFQDPPVAVLQSPASDACRNSWRNYVAVISKQIVRCF